MDVSWSFIVFVGVAAGVWSYKKHMKKKRVAFIEGYIFPPTVSKKVAEKYPHLSDKEIKLVIKGLRTYIHVCHDAQKKVVAMPSQVIDVAWHELILFTKEYRSFCRQALGRFLHHTPAEAMTSSTNAQLELKWHGVTHV